MTDWCPIGTIVRSLRADLCLEEDRVKVVGPHRIVNQASYKQSNEIICKKFNKLSCRSYQHDHL